MSKTKVAAMPRLGINLGDGLGIQVFNTVAFAPDEHGKCEFWIDGEEFDFDGLTGRQQMNFLNRIGTCWTATFKRARKKATAEQIEADLEG